MTMDTTRQVLLAAVLLLASSLAQAQVDCSKLMPDLQGRCEEVNRMNQVCGGLTGDERKKCERDNIKIPVKEDCTKVPPAAKAMCEAHNRAAEKAERCNGKMGAELEACKRENALNQPLRR